MVDRDRTDDHVARWTPILPDLDPDTEGAVTRMVHFVQHIRHVREQLLAASGLQRHEYDTLHALAGRGGTAAPTQLAGDLGMPPNSITAPFSPTRSVARCSFDPPHPRLGTGTTSLPPAASLRHTTTSIGSTGRRRSGAGPVKWSANTGR